MSATMAAPAVRTDSAQAVSLARVLVWLVLVSVALLGAGLLAATFLPNAALAGRLFAAAGEGRSGTFAQDLVAHLGERLRFSGVLLLALVAGLVVVHSAAED